MVIEPLSANSLEAMAVGAKTSFLHVYGIVLGDALKKDISTLPDEFQKAIFCEDYDDRCDACARTWMRPHAVDTLMYVVVVPCRP